ncbi:MAG: RES family NAD+ phosphorylase [Terriglobia bacterium]
MTLSAWRIVKRNLSRTAFNGEGARLFGGRWNSPGVAMVYTAQSPSLAALEILVHLDSPELLKRYVVIEVGMDDSLIAHVNLADLPRNWQADPSPVSLREIGDAWATEGRSVALRVPSAMVPMEHNFLLNPHHVDYSKLHVGKPVLFQFDPRLARERLARI